MMFPFWNENHKKVLSCLDWLLLMQFPSRNVDFSSLGLIGRRREEKLGSASIGDGIR